MPTSKNEFELVLKILADLNQKFASSLDLQESLQAAVIESVHYLQAEAGSLFLIDQQNQQLECAASTGPVDIMGLKLAINEGIVGQAFVTQQCQMMQTQENNTFSQRIDTSTGFKTNSIICAPLLIQGRCIGVLELLNKKQDALFNNQDCHFLSVVSVGIAFAIDNARKSSEVIEQARIQYELSLAREIQFGQFPQRQPANHPLHGINLPARHVSGDFYLTFKLTTQKTFFVLGDVAGKGVHAALLVARISTLIKTLVHIHCRPATILSAVNEEVLDSAIRGMFITLIVGIYHHQKERVCFANAGHIPIIFRNHKGKYRQFPALSPPTGILRETQYQEQKLDIRGGEFYMLSDGLNESLADRADPKGLKRVEEEIEKYHWLLPDSRCAGIVKQWQGARTELKDDITLFFIDSNAANITCLGRVQVLALKENLQPLRHQVKQLLASIPLSKPYQDQFILALGEAAMNIVQHGIPINKPIKIKVAIYSQKQGITLRITDNALPYDPTLSHFNKPSRLGLKGRGLFYIRSLMDEMAYFNLSNEENSMGNQLELYKRYSK